LIADPCSCVCVSVFDRKFGVGLEGRGGGSKHKYMVTLETGHTNVEWYWNAGGRSASTYDVCMVVCVRIKKILVADAYEG
jgi:hypothetical protein